MKGNASDYDEEGEEREREQDTAVRTAAPERREILAPGRMLPSLRLEGRQLRYQ
jgi:hypothetical protein